MPVISSTGPAKSRREDEREATHAALSIVSPGKEEDEEKNQDRVMLMETTDGSETCYQFAIVCDGTTTSPYSASSAEYVSSQVHLLFQEKGLRRIVRTLEEMRQALLEKPFKMEEGGSPLLQSMFEEIVKQKYQNSYQTTFVAVCLKREPEASNGTIQVKAVGCGDSALFIFRDDGELLYNNARLENALDEFKHTSPFTAVLPDSYDEQTDNLLFDFTEFPADVHLLLCSDGFYDGFTTFREMHDWLRQHLAELKDAELRGSHLFELHDRLNRKKGDDDISFIWLHPARRAVAATEGDDKATEEEEPKREEADRKNSHGGRQGPIARMFAALLRLFRFRTE